MRVHLALCRQMGVPSLSQLYEQMTAHDLAVWEAEFVIAPFDEDAANYRAGVIASNVLAPHMKQGKTPPRPMEFFRTEPARELSHDELQAVMNKVQRKHDKAKHGR